MDEYKGFDLEFSGWKGRSSQWTAYPKAKKVPLGYYMNAHLGEDDSHVEKERLKDAALARLKEAIDEEVGAF